MGTPAGVARQTATPQPLSPNESLGQECDRVPSAANVPRIDLRRHAPLRPRRATTAQTRAHDSSSCGARARELERRGRCVDAKVLAASVAHAASANRGARCASAPVRLRPRRLRVEGDGCDCGGTESGPCRDSRPGRRACMPALLSRWASRISRHLSLDLAPGSYSPGAGWIEWWALQDSNLRPSACRADALPTELNAQPGPRIMPSSIGEASGNTCAPHRRPRTRAAPWRGGRTETSRGLHAWASVILRLRGVSTCCSEWPASFVQRRARIAVPQAADAAFGGGGTMPRVS